MLNIQLSAADIANVYNYGHFFIIIGVILGLAAIGTVLLVWHSLSSKKKDGKIRTDTPPATK